VPSGTGAFRIQRWSLKKDWSVEIQGQTVTASMYDLDVGPKPIDRGARPPAAPVLPYPARPAWAPYQVQAASWDALFLTNGRSIPTTYTSAGRWQRARQPDHNRETNP